jgi:hypothetical protein
MAYYSTGVERGNERTCGGEIIFPDLANLSKGIFTVGLSPGVRQFIFLRSLTHRRKRKQMQGICF